MMSTTAPLIEARAISKRFVLPGGRELLAVDNVTLSIEQGTLAVVTGGSGSGKSTLLGLLGELARPTSGEVYFAGQEFGRCWDGELANLRRRVGFVFQSFMLLPRLPIWEGLTYGLIAQGWNRSRRRETAAAVLSRLSLADRLDQRPEELSGGEQQRVALARALVGEPELILADEPTSNLDAAVAGTVLELLSELHRAGRTLIISTHDPRLAELATWRAEMDHGRLRSFTN